MLIIYAILIVVRSWSRVCYMDVLFVDGLYIEFEFLISGCLFNQIDFGTV